MSKKIALVLVLVLVAAMIFSGCAPKESYEVTALSGDTTGEVISNGGIAVLKGDYYYLVNGAVSSYTLNNGFGQVLAGSIIRLTKNDLLAALQAPDSLALVERQAQIVVSKYYYSANTTDKSINGIYIYAERLYYLTPDVSYDKNGAVQAQQLCLMSCALDGTGTKLHYTFETNTLPVALLMGSDNVVYAVWKDVGLYSVNTATGKRTEIAKEITTVKYDTDSGVAYYLTSDGDIGCYTNGAGSIVVKNPTVKGESITTVTYTLMDVDQGVAYYTAKGAYDNSKTGAFSTDKSGAVKQYFSYQPTSFKVANGKLYIVGNTSYDVIEYDPATKTTRLLASPGEASTINYINKDYIVVTMNKKLVKVNLVDLTSSTLTTLTPYSNWSDYDFCGDYTMIIGATGNDKWYPIEVVTGAGKSANVTKGYILPEATGTEE